MRNNLRRWRKQNGVSLGDVAHLTGISAPTLSRVERGKRRLSGVKKVQLARALGVPLAELFPRGDE